MTGVYDFIGTRLRSAAVELGIIAAMATVAAATAVPALIVS